MADIGAAELNPIKVKAERKHLAVGLFKDCIYNPFAVEFCEFVTVVMI